MQEPIIAPSHYDGLMHKVAFVVGPDFTAKWDAYRADGFTVGLLASEPAFLACKIMCGEPLPRMAA